MGEGCPLMLAEVEISGLRKRRITCRQKGSCTIRMATDPSCATKLSGKPNGAVKNNGGGFGNFFQKLKNSRIGRCHVL